MTEKINETSVNFVGGERNITDLGELSLTERIVEILSPGTQRELGIRVTLMHVDDKRLKKVKRHFTDEAQRLQRKGKSFKAKEIENNLALLTFSAMTGWEWYGDITFEGEKPQFNQKNVLEVFEKHPWFQAQIIEEMGDDEAFFTI